ncbi:uncharacterized protein SRS1_14297 [Sporisorium reilianum f. sp. reilianum]|uniref:BZIP domain-containing protein n=1 Tax=Sporisorium reilianum f. sp. reilianum TaxID=72559 RepID=A0A2N8UGK8_9BASI|nr:uncharacterized protein SRS1_14297 [Sporisorium reilianum f. sp. reilianum]
MPVIMRPPTKTNDEMLDAERLRQIARRKEQNRNAQRRLRERKEEYTMQLEAQLAELHRRSQSQEEESHFLREALARMRAENQTLAEQIAMIHQAVPSTQSSHPLPQRASIDLGVDHFAPLNRSRNRSQSVTATMMPRFAFNHNVAAPWATSSQQPMPPVHTPFGATIAPGATHRLPFSTASPLAGAPSLAAGASSGMAVPQHEPTEDAAMPRSDDASRTRSISPASQRRESSIISPFDLKGNLSRHGSGQTELTIPPDSSEAESGPASKIRRVSDCGRVMGASVSASPAPLADPAAPVPSRNMAPLTTSSVGEAKTDVAPLPTASDDVMASCLESIHSLPQASADAHATQRTHFDQATSWMASNNEISGQLALPDLRNPDLSSISKPLGLTPGALGLTNAMPGSGAGGDGWSISPWIHLAATPSAGMATDMEHTSSRSFADSQRLETGMAFDNKKSLASRRGFSGSLKFETRAS